MRPRPRPGPRPVGERWVGKNWACSRAMEQVMSAWVLFMIADVRLQPATLRRALAQASADGADLLSRAPRLSCRAVHVVSPQHLPGDRRLVLLAALALALAGIGLQLVLRLWIRRQFLLPITFWWLMGAGGLVVAAIGPVSVWRTLSGRGWTWKGRPLA